MKGSFFSLLIKNYVAFTAVNVALVIIIFSLGSVVLAAHLKMPGSNVERQLSLLESGRYDKIKDYKLTGPSGYFEILNENNKVVYISDSSKKKEVYTEGELACIPDYISDIYMDVQKHKDKQGKDITIIIANTYYDVPEEELKKEFIIVLDDKRKVIYASPNVTKEQYTEREYGFLINDDKGKLYTSKYEFKGQDGNKYTMIINTAFSDKRTVNAYYRGLACIGIAIIICYILSIFFFVKWLTRKVKKPLTVLNNAMISFAKGDKESVVNYSGAAEFVHICDSFNEMAELLRKSEEAKLQIEDQKSKMLADISHDLKTPITTIQGYAKALADGIIVKEEQQKYLDKIYNKSIDLTELINTFYEYSKLEHPDFAFLFENIEINEFFREYLAQRYEEIMDKDFLLEIDIPEQITICSIDKLQFRRGLDNIINNSLKHNPKGTTMYVNIGYADKDEREGYLKIIMADDGLGIPQELVKDIFDPFVVGDDSRNSKQGSGLGLSISKKIIEGHGGVIELIPSEKSEYSTEFVIYIPIIKL